MLEGINARFELAKSRIFAELDNEEAMHCFSTAEGEAFHLGRIYSHPPKMIAAEKELLHAFRQGYNYECLIAEVSECPVCNDPCSQGCQLHDH